MITKVIETLPVIFRAERSGDYKGDVTAVFPTVCADYAGLEFTIYDGCHGGGRLGWYYQTRAAKPAEYAELLAGLRRIYENALDRDDPVFKLEVRQRMTRKHRDALQEDARQARARLRSDPSGGPWSPSAINETQAAMTADMGA